MSKANWNIWLPDLKSVGERQEGNVLEENLGFDVRGIPGHLYLVCIQILFS